MGSFTFAAWAALAVQLCGAYAAKDLPGDVGRLPASSFGVELDESMLLDARATLADVENAFALWIQKHGRDYLHDPEVFNTRLQTFTANAEFVARHNEESPNVRLALNEFADMSFEEFAQSRLGLDVTLERESPAMLSSFRHENVDVPDAIDWVEKGAVTPIKDQGACGSCWAFSTTGSIEGVDYLETGKLKMLSEQELVDCDKAKDMGCSGGLMNNAFDFVIKNGGLDTENDYRYWGSFPSFCNRRKEADRHVVDITGFEQVPRGNESALAQAVASQPVSVAICVDRSLQLYHSGVYDEKCCTGLNHGVLAVGYGEADGTPFWKVKNSWGAAWGEQGFFRLKKDRGGFGQCGIAMMPSYPVKDDRSDPVTSTICDPQLFSLWECPPRSKCNCDFNLFGLLCLSYECEPKDAVAAEGGEGAAYCPTEAPLLSSEDGRCYSADHMLNSAPLFKHAATRRLRV